MYEEYSTYNKFVLTSPWLKEVDTHGVLIVGGVLNTPAKSNMITVIHYFFAAS